MGMTKEGMRAKIETYIDAITMPAQSTTGDVSAHRTLMLEAMCLGIIEEIQQNAVVTTTSGAPNEEHTGEIN